MRKWTEHVRGRQLLIWDVDHGGWAKGWVHVGQGARESINLVSGSSLFAELCRRSIY